MSVINNLILLEAFIYDDRDLLWRHGVVVITAAQLHLIKLELGFSAGSNPARRMSEIRDGEGL